MDSLDVKFVTFLIFFILLGSYMTGIPRGFLSSNNGPGTQNPPPYVYSSEHIGEIEKSFSLVNFSGLTTNEAVKREIDAVFQELNESNCKMSGISEDFYAAGIYTFIPTLAYSRYDLIQCEGDSGNTSLARNEMEDLLNEIRKIDKVKGQSPWLAIAELYLEWQLPTYSLNATAEQAAFDLNCFIPFLRQHMNTSYKTVSFSLLNITQTRRKLEGIIRYTEKEKNFRVDLICLGLGWLNLSESAYQKDEKSLSLWYYSVALAYLNVTGVKWAAAPLPSSGTYQTGMDVPYNISGLRAEVYRKALQFVDEKGNGPYAELLSNYILLDLRQLDRYNLRKLSDPSNPLLDYYPYMVYHSYLRLLAMVTAIEIFSSYFS